MMGYKVLDAGGVFKIGQSTAGLLCKEVSFELLFTLYVQN